MCRSSAIETGRKSSINLLALFHLTGSVHCFVCIFTIADCANFWHTEVPCGMTAVTVKKSLAFLSFKTSKILYVLLMVNDTWRAYLIPVLWNIYSIRLTLIRNMFPCAAMRAPNSICPNLTQTGFYMWQQIPKSASSLSWDQIYGHQTPQWCAKNCENWVANFQRFELYLCNSIMDDVACGRLLIVLYYQHWC